jgi:hypothetical protein
MTRVLLAAACLVAIAGRTAQHSEAVGVESAVQGQDEIKRFIQFERLLATIDANAGVAVAWPDLRQFFPPDERGWELYKEQVDFAEVPGLVERLSLFRNGDAQITVDLFVSSRGPRPALERLVDVMAATSIGYRRFQPGPADIGQLCLVLPVPNPTVLVIDRNVFVRIRRTNHTMDLIPVARALAKFMDEHVVPALVARTPVMAGVSVSPETPGVHESARVALQLPTEFAAADLMWSLSPQLDRDVVDVREQGADHAEVRIGRAGRIELPIWLADRRTLLSSETRLVIDVPE